MNFKRRNISPRGRIRAVVYLLLIGLALTWASGCGVYYNTFFNAKKAFNKAEKARKNARQGARSAGSSDYLKTIEKCQKVVDNHPKSKYYDDAVYLLGVSYYHTEQYGRADRRFRELLADFPDSKFARDAHLYLAKTKLALGEIEDARLIFEEIFRSDLPKEYKVDAAWALGRYHVVEKDYDLAESFFRAIRDSLGSGTDVLQAQIDIADSYFDAFRFGDALGAYLQVSALKPDNNQRYHATFQAARSAFSLMRIKTGIAYLDGLAKDELYYDSLSSLKLAMARGYEKDDDLLTAEDVYDEVIKDAVKPVAVAQAYYRLGLIYQTQYNDLTAAKGYYDKAAEQGGNTPVRAAAIQRSADIGKLKQYEHMDLDTAATAAEIDDAAFTQFQLAELYWLNLDQPDSAIKEMTYLVDSMPKSYFTPKGMIALAEMIRFQTGDDSTADSLLREVIRQYPRSDFVPDALEPLGLLGTPADTGYAKAHFNRAEDYLIEAENIDSARAEYQYVIDHYPLSRYYVPARFNLIWLTENYEAPGDSSVILAYREFADSFPSDPLAATALTRIGDVAAAAEVKRQMRQDTRPELPGAEETGGGAEEETPEEADTGSTYVDPKLALYKGANGESLVDLRLDPIEILEPFEFPDQAATINVYEWHLYYQVLIDFSGRVVDYVLKIPSGVSDIDKRASETVGSMTFDAAEVSNRAVSAGLTDQPEGDGRWFVYEYVVEKPDYLR